MTPPHLVPQEPTSLSHCHQRWPHRIETGLLRPDRQRTAIPEHFGTLSAGELMQARALIVNPSTLAADATIQMTRAFRALVIRVLAQVMRAAMASRAISRRRLAAEIPMTASTSGLLVTQNVARWMINPSSTRASKRSEMCPSAWARASSSTFLLVLATAKACGGSSCARAAAR